MRKHCSNVCNLRPCLDKESNNSERKCTILATALRRQYSQTELTFWITYVINPYSLVYGLLNPTFLLASRALFSLNSYVFIS
jgi:hypothetical protein